MRKTAYFAGLWSGGPVAHVGVYRFTRVAPDAYTDSVDGLQPSAATLTWEAYIWNYGSDVLKAPKISVDGSTQTFVPPVTFPLSLKGNELPASGVFSLFDFDTGNGGHVANTEISTGFDALSDDVAGGHPRRRRDGDRDRVGDGP